MDLFVYGTLHPNCAPPDIAETARCMRFNGAGWVRGRLIDLGDYPGLIAGDGRVEGTVFAVPSDAWPALDAYEGCIQGAPEASLFLRQKIAVSMADGSTRSCWVYRYVPGDRLSTNATEPST